MNRKTEILVDGEWQEFPFELILPGDVFRLTELDGKPVLDYNGRWVQITTSRPEALEEGNNKVETKGQQVVVVFGAGHPDNLGSGIGDVLEKAGHVVYRADIAFAERVFRGLPMDKCLPCDVTIYDMIYRSMKTVFDREGRIDAIVNSAGVNLLGAIDDYPEESWDKTINVNLKAPMLATKAFVNLCGEQAGVKTVINIGSNTAYIPRTRTFAYGASKSGLVHLTRCLARELAPRKFAVIQLDIGIVDGTPMHRKTHRDLWEQRGWDEERINRERLANVPYKRYSNPREAGDWVRFLIEKGDYATGNCIRIDGAEK